MDRLSDATPLSVPALADARRLAELQRLRILDTPLEADYDAIAGLGAAILRSPVAAVNLVDDERHFTKAIVGMPEAIGGSVPNDISFCAATVTSPDGILVPGSPESALSRRGKIGRPSAFARLRSRSALPEPYECLVEPGGAPSQAVELR